MALVRGESPAFSESGHSISCAPSLLSFVDGTSFSFCALLPSPYRTGRVPMKCMFVHCINVYNDSLNSKHTCMGYCEVMC